MARGLLAELGSAFEAHRDAERARGMASYMRDQFPYYGIPAPEQRAIARPRPVSWCLKTTVSSCRSTR